jgi:hypothetical protein
MSFYPVPKVQVPDRRALPPIRRKMRGYRESNPMLVCPSLVDAEGIWFAALLPPE